MDELVFETREMLAEITAPQHPDVAAALLEGALDGDRSFVVLSVLEALARDGAAAELVHDAEQWLVGVTRTAPTHDLVRAACRIAEHLSGAAAAELDEQWRAAATMAVADGRENVFPVGRPTRCRSSRGPRTRPSCPGLPARRPAGRRPATPPRWPRGGRRTTSILQWAATSTPRGSDRRAAPSPTRQAPPPADPGSRPAAVGRGCRPIDE